MPYKPERSSVIHRILGHLGEKKVSGSVRLLREDAYCKCSCGATLMCELDFRLHTGNTGICVTFKRVGWKEITSLIDSL
jgi:hypothetical protein